MISDLRLQPWWQVWFTHMCPCGTVRLRLLRTFSLPYERHTSRHRIAESTFAAGREASRSAFIFPSFSWKQQWKHLNTACLETWSLLDMKLNLANLTPAQQDKTALYHQYILYMLYVICTYTTKACNDFKCEVHSNSFCKQGLQRMQSRSKLIWIQRGEKLLAHARNVNIPASVCAAC